MSEADIKDTKALVTVAGVQALSGTLDLPEMGAWTAAWEIDVEDKDAPATGSAADIIIAPQVSTEGGAKTSPKVFKGTVLWRAPWQGRTRMWMTGGKGGLRKLVSALNTVAGPLPLPVLDLVNAIIAETGETLSEDAKKAVADLTVGRVHRIECTGAAALSALLTPFGLVWRLKPDGEVWIGPLDYPEDKSQPYVCDPGDDGADRSFMVAPDQATILPCTTLLGRALNRVVYEAGESGIRTRCFYGSSERDDFEGAVRTVLPEIPYLESYEATVVSQQANGMLEVLCDDARVGPLANVVLLAGMPDSWNKTTQGQRVRILFASGDPKLYYAMGFEMEPAAAPPKSTSKGIAREGDRIDCGWYTATAPPGGGPCTVVAGGAEGVPGAFRVTGTIIEGHPNLRVTDDGQ